MSKKKRTSKRKPRKEDLLELSDCKKLRLLKEAKKTLQQRLVEAKVWQSLAETTE